MEYVVYVDIQSSLSMCLINVQFSWNFITFDSWRIRFICAINLIIALLCPLFNFIIQNNLCVSLFNKTKVIFQLFFSIDL